MSKEQKFISIVQKLREIGEGQTLPPIKVPPRRRPGPQQEQEPGTETHAPGSGEG